MLTRRILSAVVLIPVVLWVIYKGGALYFALVAIASLPAGYEFYWMMSRGGYRPSCPLGMALIASFLLDARYPSWQLARLSLAAALLLSLVQQLFQKDAHDALVDWALTLAGALYIGWLASHFVSLRDLGKGTNWTMLALLPTWACDTGAYSVGMAFGRHPFFARISPHKTWEGAIGGWVSGIMATVLIGSFIGISVGHGLILGLIIALAATFGDLAESLLKRQVGVKDSSHLIPGHGGMLDRIDSLLFTVVVVYYYAAWVMNVR